MITKNIVWDHRGRTKAGAEGPVEIRVYHNGERFYINTGIKVRGRELRDGMIVGRQDADVLNERLAIVTERVMKAVNRCIEQGIPIDVSEVKNRCIISVRLTLTTARQCSTGSPGRFRS